MPMFKVRLTRLIEQECSTYVRAATVDEANEKALEQEAESVADCVWQTTESEPHTYTAEAEPHCPDTVQTPAERPQDAAPTTETA